MNTLDNTLGIFVGQSRTRLVRGRVKFKVENTHPPTTEDPQATVWAQENFPRELTKIEELYNEFCKKAYDLIVMHPSMNGENLPHRVIFPNFYYEIIRDKFPVE